MAKEYDKLTAMYEKAMDKPPKPGDTGITKFTNPYDASPTYKVWVLGEGTTFTPFGTKTLEEGS